MAEWERRDVPADELARVAPDALGVDEGRSVVESDAHGQPTGSIEDATAPIKNRSGAPSQRRAEPGRT